jgi:hypothetical protein
VGWGGAGRGGAGRGGAGWGGVGWGGVGWGGVGEADSSGLRMSHCTLLDTSPSQSACAVIKVHVQ